VPKSLLTTKVKEWQKPLAYRIAKISTKLKLAHFLVMVYKLCTLYICIRCRVNMFTNASLLNFFMIHKSINPSLMTKSDYQSKFLLQWHSSEYWLLTMAAATVHWLWLWTYPGVQSLLRSMAIHPGFNLCRDLSRCTGCGYELTLGLVSAEIYVMVSRLAPVKTNPMFRLKCPKEVLTCRWACARPKKCYSVCLTVSPFQQIQQTCFSH